MNCALSAVRCPSAGAAGTGNAELLCDELKRATMRPSEPTYDDVEPVRDFWGYVPSLLRSLDNEAPRGE